MVNNQAPEQVVEKAWQRSSRYDRQTREKGEKTGFG